ncbi:hypothetical protein [Thiobacillus denitrificans]|uniref:hypothetical protein n=1 Tax=Thiobacillus denitrificans TaxID=36861 RepID=UPI0012FBFE78|nr:hypothetical protein [Thiobacillus denitrificans]
MRTPKQASAKRATVLSLLLVALQGCAAVGPAALNNGRSAYNTVINATEDEQILSIIVRRRYDETFGILAVSSVTASLRIGASAGTDVRIGPSGDYQGNLVPFSAGVTYEENPTISYVPMRGEQFIERMLSPVSAEQALLLSRMSTEEVEVLRMLVRRANGIVNPLFSSQPVVDGGNAFNRFVDLYGWLRERGRLDIVRSGDRQYQMLLHNFTQAEANKIGALLQVLGIQERSKNRDHIALPLRFFVGEPRTDVVDLETPSALEIIEAAGSGVEVPDAHLSEGLARSSVKAGMPALIAIHSSRDRPSRASVATMHKGWWLYVDARDARSKQAFMILQALIGLRLDEGNSGRGSPVLTIPVAR